MSVTSDAIKAINRATSDVGKVGDAIEERVKSVSSKYNGSDEELLRAEGVSDLNTLVNLIKKGRGVIKEMLALEGTGRKFGNFSAVANSNAIPQLGLVQGMAKEVELAEKRLKKFKALKTEGLARRYLDLIKRTGGLTTARPSVTKALQTAEKLVDIPSLEKANKALFTHMQDASKQAKDQPKEFQKFVTGIVNLHQEVVKMVAEARKI